MKLGVVHLRSLEHNGVLVWCGNTFVDCQNMTPKTKVGVTLYRGPRDAFVQNIKIVYFYSGVMTIFRSSTHDKQRGGRV